ncbi:MAG: hypothetical protein GYA82_07400, partial [Synergistaceae bacterium]|nr:hypothetical protein [Synergistaceae bacterium]
MVKAHQYDVTLDRKKIHLDTPIRSLGEHEVELRLHPDVTSKLKVLVESSTPLELPPAPQQAGTAPATAQDKPARSGKPVREKKTGSPREESAKRRPPR